MSFLRLVKRESVVSNRWKGGVTNELFVSPTGSTFSKFDFDFRVSWATVEIETSTFSFMPGVTRHLMLLDGNLQLKHIISPPGEGKTAHRNNVTLQPFEQHVFFGEWPTEASGKVRDFNLLLRGARSGNLSLVHLTGAAVTFVCAPGDEFRAWFVVSGTFIVAGGCGNSNGIEKSSGSSFVAEAGDLVWATREQQSKRVVFEVQRGTQEGEGTLIDVTVTRLVHCKI